MPKKKYNLSSVITGTAWGDNNSSIVNSDDVRYERPFERNLLDLSSIGIKYNTSLIRSMRSIETGYNTNDPTNNGMFPEAGLGYDYSTFQTYRNMPGQNDYIAIFDQQYIGRRQYLRNFALNGEIDFVLETIANEAIVLDDMNYFAYPDTKSLKARLKDNKDGKQVIDDLNAAFRRVYAAWKFNEGCDAWHWLKRFLIDGFLCFEILYKTDEKSGNATDIIGFAEIDPTVIKPEIEYDSNGNEVKVWYMYKGDAKKERRLLDANVIYISWAKNNFISRLSYVERLIRPYNMLHTIECSHMIWNVQNAQKRVNVSIPVGGGGGGTNGDQRAMTRVNEFAAYFKEDVTIDDASGELLVNGQPKFQFYKTFLTPSRNGEKIEISEITAEGHDMNTTESLKYYWQRFMIETGIPKDRFSMMFGEQSSQIITDKSQMTKEEYKFSLFINRVRDLFQELLIKPMWIQFCFKYPQFQNNEILRSAIGITYVEENIFQKEKERAFLEAGANTINTLSQMKKSDGQSPMFSSKFLFEKFLMLSEDDWKLNEKYLKEEAKENKNNPQQQNNNGGGMPIGGDAGVFGDMTGGGTDMGGGFGEEPQQGTDMTGGNDIGGFTEPEGFDTTGNASVENNFEAGGEVAPF